MTEQVSFAPHRVGSIGRIELAYVLSALPSCFSKRPTRHDLG